MALSLDLLIVLTFFLLTFGIGLLERRKITLDDYWVNRRRTNKFVLTATITSSFLGVGSLLSNAGVAFSGGGLASFFLMSSFLVYFLLFAKFFAPTIKEFGDATGAYTLPDFLEHRYSRRMRIVGLLLNGLCYGLWLSLQILGMGLFVSTIGTVNPTLATIMGGVIVIAYTTVGGLRADIRTDVFQFLVMLLLLLILPPLLLMKGNVLSGLTRLSTSYWTGQEFAPWYVYVLGFLSLGASTIVSADLWQRSYAAESTESIRWAMKAAGVIVFLFLTMGTFLGVFGKILLPGATANTIVPELLRASLPPFLFGIVLAGFFAAIMSTADTILLILSMTLVHDLCQRTLQRKLSPGETLRLSRWTTLILGSLAVLIALTIFNVVHLAIDAVSFLAVLLPAVVFGFLWKNATEPAAFWSTVLGALTTAIFLPLWPVEAFIPGIGMSFLSFFIINTIVQSRQHTASAAL
jgi:SSS family solute:Na+ symporter